MSSCPDQAEAAAGANTVELISVSFGSAIGGVLVNLLIGFAIIAALGVLTPGPDLRPMSRSARAGSATAIASGVARQPAGDGLS